MIETWSFAKNYYKDNLFENELIFAWRDRGHLDETWLGKDIVFLP